MRLNVAPAALYAALCFVPCVARADVPPEPVFNPCAGKQVGEACGAGGVCSEGQCCTQRHVSATIRHYESRKPLDQQDPDIMNPPSTCVACLKCEAATAPVVTPPAATPPAAPAVPEPAAAAPAKPTQAGMCAVGAGAGDVGGGLLLGVLLCGGVRSRRRCA